MEVTIEKKLNEYKEHIEALKSIDELEVYNWLMSLGEKLNNDPLSDSKKNFLIKQVMKTDGCNPLETLYF